MKRVVAIAFAGIVATSATAQAADRFGTLTPPTVFGQPTEITSGWYLRGDVGFTESNTPTIIPQGVPQNELIPAIFPDKWYPNVPVVDPPIGDATHNVGAMRGNNQNSGNPSFAVGFGYRFNDNFRMDATYTYWTGAAYSSGKLSTLCPGSGATGAMAVTNQVVTGHTTATATQPSQPIYTAEPVGYDWTFNSCNGYVNARQFNQTGLVNAYYDIGNFWGVTPYVGAGVGLNANIVTGTSQLYNTNDGTAYAGNTSATSSGTPLTWVTQTGTVNGQPFYSRLAPASQNVTFGAQNWNRNIYALKYNFAWAVMGGLSYPISHNLFFDLGYRYLSAPIGSLANNTQEVHLGVRLMAY